MKRWAEIELGIMTQCILVKTLTKFTKMTAQNLIFKINCKLGGLNWTIKPKDPTYDDNLIASFFFSFVSAICFACSECAVF